jgi:hypothetical protein
MQGIRKNERALLPKKPTGGAISCQTTWVEILVHFENMIWLMPFRLIEGEMCTVALVAAVQQDDHRAAVAPKIDPIVRSPIDPELACAVAQELHVSEIACFQPLEPRQDARSRLPVR